MGAVRMAARMVLKKGVVKIVAVVGIEIVIIHVESIAKKILMRLDMTEGVTAAMGVEVVMSL
jgi:hypothetical protein